MIIKVRKIASHCRTPRSSEEYFALVATDYFFDPNNGVYEYGTGFAIKIPNGFIGIISVLENIKDTDFILLTTRRYSGDDSEVVVRFRSISGRSDLGYNVGETVAIMSIQEVPFVDIEIEEE